MYHVQSKQHHLRTTVGTWVASNCIQVASCDVIGSLHAVRFEMCDSCDLMFSCCIVGAAYNDVDDTDTPSIPMTKSIYSTMDDIDEDAKYDIPTEMGNDMSKVMSTTTEKEHQEWDW